MIDFFDQHRYNTSAGPDFKPEKYLPVSRPETYPVRYIAYYLPQFHEIEENNQWWGQGFTEWTNVTKAVPRYSGHLQPRLPGGLGFYDLSDANILRKQAELAMRGGISGFCIHDYWFSGRKVLGKPLNLLLENSDIDLPFCLNWANESWSRRWDGSEVDILLEQVYDTADMTGYVRSILPALADKRYIRIGSRPLIMVYRPQVIPEQARMFDAWREFLVKEGFDNPYLVRAQTFLGPDGDPGDFDPRVYGMDAAAGFPPHTPGVFDDNDGQYRHLLDPEYRGIARSYSFLAKQMLGCFSDEFVNLPGVCPGWDNEARKPGRGLSFYGASPDQYRAWLMNASSQVLKSNKPDERIVFINAWNEWAEGAVLEPDRHFGYAFLGQTRAALDELTAGGPVGSYEIRDDVQRSTWARMRNLARRKLKQALQPAPGQ